jgi:heme/copper-type cytochrome/quinol oxidase subunit 3
VDRPTLFFMVMGLCIVNGLFSPFLNIAVPVSAALMPELFPRTIEWVLFWASVLLSTATLLFSGVPAALYERLVENDTLTSMWIWLGCAALLTAPVVLRG